MAHQQYDTTLKQMVGRVLSIKPTLPPTLAESFINDCIRMMVDRRPNWSGLVKHSTIYVPAPITTGGVDLTQNSDSITITSTTWPVADVVNTTIPSAINRTGLQTVVPASMTGIGVDTLLYVDSSGTPEIVAVKSITANSFTAKFLQFHNAGSTITASSYSGRQLKLGVTYPIYTVLAVTSTTTATIDQKWYAAAMSSGYTLVKLYYTIDPSLKSIMSVTDQVQGIPPLAINKPVQYLDVRDPQRTATGYPNVLATRMPNLNGNMVYELWPMPTAERQLTAIWTEQPALLSADDDFLPAFINPSVVFLYASAMAWGSRIGEQDPYFDPGTSNRYMSQFERQFNDACKSDDEKAGSGLFWDDRVYGLGSYWNASHSIDAINYTGY